MVAELLTKMMAKKLGKTFSNDRNAMFLGTLTRFIGRNMMINQTKENNDKLKFGIWKKEENGDWIRDPDQRSEWRCWADSERIPRKGKRIRIVLLGESVARGYFFDPIFNPAIGLQNILESISTETYEVIDCARIDINQFQINSLIKKVNLLDPDIVLFWGGNNWVHFDEFSLNDIQKIIKSGKRLYKTSNKIFIEKILPSVSRRIVSALNDQKEKYGTKIIVIVPDWNLLDWVVDDNILLPFTPDESHVAWMQHREKAVRSVECKEWKNTILHATSMLKYDGGLSMTTHRLLATAYFGLGNVKKAKECFEMSRDAMVGIPIKHSPRCPAVVQNELRTSAREKGMAIVDLPQIFGNQCGPISDRNLFMDYCHHSLTGIAIAVNAIAGTIIELGNKSEVPSNAVDRSCSIPPSDHAVAHLLAAMHNAHYGQNEDILIYHFREAYKLDNSIVGIMKNMIDFMNRRANRMLSASFHEIARNRAMERYLQPRETTDWEKFNERLLNKALLKVLKEAGIDEEKKYVDLMVSEHARSLKKINLLNHQYSATTFRGVQGYTLGSQPTYLQAIQEKKDVMLVLDAYDKATIHITYRIVGEPLEHECVELLCNNKVVFRGDPSRTWRSHSIAIPSDVVTIGENVITVKWPLQRFDWDTHFRNVMYCLGNGEMPNALPVYGEICKMTCEKQDARHG